jgi:FeS assembly SUF system regulator
MVRISKMTDYAVVLLAQMVRREGLVSTTSLLVEGTGLPHPTASKILKMLVKGGLLTAQRGSTGGYALAKSAREITVADIVTAMDGPISLTDCAEGSSHVCQMEGTCPMSSPWNRVNRVIRNALRDVTLYEMAMDMPPQALKANATRIIQ